MGSDVNKAGEVICGAGIGKLSDIAVTFEGQSRAINQIKESPPVCVEVVELYAPGGGGGLGAPKPSDVVAAIVSPAKCGG